jgi:pimeloyl-ACP methyl ester carboxylesterase
MRDVSIPVPGGHINAWHRPSQGGAESAVLVHGLSGNSRWWSSVIEHFPENVGLVALDVRGRGLSTDSPAPYDLSTVADDIARCLDHFGLERAVVAGYSMGAWAVALFGLHHTDRVERLVLVDGGFPMPREPEQDPKSFIDALVGPALRRLEIEFESEEAFFDHWRAHPALERHWDDSMKTGLAHELREENDHFRVRANPEAIAVTAREITVGEEANAAAAKLNVPTHLIVVERGTMDQPGGMIPLDVAKEAAQANRLLTMQFLPDVNHYTLILGKGAPAVASAIAGAR